MALAHEAARASGEVLEVAARLAHRLARNLWLGTSITAKNKVHRVRHLLNVGDEHTVRFVSVEPQWEPIDLSAWLPRLDWCLRGGESGSIAKPFDLAWADGLRMQCRTAKTAYFLTQLGAHVVEKGKRIELEDRHGGDRNEWPARLRVRQVPTVRGRFRRESTSKALA